MTTIAQFGNRSLAVGKQYAPEALAIVGVAGVVTAGVLAARATLKLEAVIEKLENSKADALNLLHETKEIEQPEYKALMFKAHRTFILDLIKLYGLPVSIGVFGIGAILGGQGVLKRRNVALLGAYKSLEQVYGEYRKRVAAEVGVEKEREIRLNLRAMEDDDAVVSTDDGDKPMALLSEEELKRNALGASQYARFYDEFNKNWQKNRDDNMAFLLSKQAYFNNRLAARGYMFLNEVYKELGFEETKAGQFVGWTVRPGADNYIDFDIFVPENKRFVNGDEYSVLLDFNVDGVIVDEVFGKK